MAATTVTIGEVEEMVILAILRLGQNAYGVAIEELLSKATNNTLNVRGIYTTLQRLKQKGLITELKNPPATSSKGPARKYYAVEMAGKKALKNAESERQKWRAHRDKIDMVMPKIQT